MTGSSGFLLSKWYLDCVAEDGTTFIGYAALLRWKLLSLHFSNILLRRPNEGTKTESSLTSHDAPQRDGSSIRWTHRAFSVEGNWTGLSNPINRQLYKDEDGEIVWSCLLPMARATIRIGNTPAIEGLGYVEHLSLSLLPWKLPITELRWGRFLMNAGSLIWIDWRGPVRKRLVLHNGEEVDDATITDFEIQGSGGRRLSLLPEAVVRNGSLLSSTLSGIPGIVNMFPAGILRTHECKWLSRGNFELNHSCAGEGWAIHELVKFK